MAYTMAHTVKFTESFQDYVCEGDSIACRHGALYITAKLYRDDLTVEPCQDKPNELDEGFWPVRGDYQSDRGYQRAYNRAKRIMEAWKNDEWHYYGIAVTIQCGGLELVEKFQHAVWGVEGNYPSGRKHRNAYLTTVANELLCEAMDTAWEALEKICEVSGDE